MTESTDLWYLEEDAITERLVRFTTAVKRGLAPAPMANRYVRGPNPALIAEIGADKRNALGWAGNGHRWDFSSDPIETEYWPSD